MINLSLNFIFKWLDINKIITILVAYYFNIKIKTNSVGIISETGL